MVVVDTTVWIDYIHGLKTPYTNALDYELLHNQVITGDLLITEFLQGFRDDDDFEAAKKNNGQSDILRYAGKRHSLKIGDEFPFIAKKWYNNTKNSGYYYWHFLHRA